jgi:membrane-bound serine protease (ClpP class)
MRKIILLIIIILSFAGVVFTQAKEPFYIIPIKGAIDLGLSSFMKRTIGEAKENNAKTLILEIDTFGGRVDAALDICKYLQDFRPIKTIAFIEGNAWSAGALIALASQNIIMAPGSSIGSAEPKAMGFGAQDTATDEKIVSAIRAKFKSIAEANNYPVNLALAMVDKDFEIKLVKVKDDLRILTAQEIEELKPQYKESQIQIIKTISPKGKLLNLTATEAKEVGLASAIVKNRQELFKHLKFNEKDAIFTKITWSEALVRLITHPLISPLLLTLGFLGLIFELKIPGWGISGTLGVIFLALFFWGHYLAGLANWTEIVIFGIGVVLVFLEIFILPGFGIAGIAGMALIVTGIFLALLKFPLHLPQIQLGRAFSTLGYAIVFTVLAAILGLKFLPKTRLWKSIILTTEEKKEEGFRSTVSFDKYLGKIGKTITALRPSGKANIDGEMLDVITEGDFIEKDKHIVVADVSGGKIVVKEA